MSGKSDQAKGRVEEAYGALSGDEELQAEGKRDQLAGKAKNKTAQAEEDVEHGIDKAKDAIESTLDKTKKALHRK
ncbi:CsbD-like [Pedococcus cremeus]|uniref:CsbD-like n=1 Tax=Pedococcus cremeus TaxID=587636 RepID=A0A1H9WQ12_9MICO|nr:CsbD family protein [Pedococcus cremeus]SES36018.1 CsbD-like [Pedococcus cremeus]